MFVQRDDAGLVKGVYACLQEGYAEEELPADHPDVLAFLNRDVPERDPLAEIDALKQALIGKRVIAEADVAAAEVSLTAERP